MLNYQREEDEKNIRRRTAVNMAVNTLSYSELRAVSAILSELKGNEGQLTASIIAGSDWHYPLCDCQCTPEIGVSWYWKAVLLE